MIMNRYSKLKKYTNRVTKKLMPNSCCFCGISQEKIVELCVMLENITIILEHIESTLQKRVDGKEIEDDTKA